MDVSALLSALGLSGAAGLNAYIPLMLIAALARSGAVHLAAPFDVLGSWWALTALGVLLAIEIVVDKVPGADHVNDVVQTFVRPAAGAVLFASQSGVAGLSHPGIAFGCGLVLALGVHATKAAARPVVNAATLGVGAPVISTAEDVLSAATSVIAVFLPFLMGVVVVAFLVLAFWVWSRRRAGACVSRGDGVGNESRNP